MSIVENSIGQSTAEVWIDHETNWAPPSVGIIPYQAQPKEKPYSYLCQVSLMKAKWMYGA
jgi:hypothetical protein